MCGAGNCFSSNVSAAITHSCFPLQPVPKPKRESDKTHLIMNSMQYHLITSATERKRSSSSRSTKVGRTKKAKKSTSSASEEDEEEDEEDEEEDEEEVCC